MNTFTAAGMSGRRFSSPIINEGKILTPPHPMASYIIEESVFRSHRVKDIRNFVFGLVKDSIYGFGKTESRNLLYRSL